MAFWVGVHMKQLLFLALFAGAVALPGQAPAASGQRRALAVEQTMAIANSQWQAYLREICDAHFEADVVETDRWNQVVIDHTPAVEIEKHRVVCVYPMGLLYKYGRKSTSVPDKVMDIVGVNAEYSFRLTPSENAQQKWVVRDVARVARPPTTCRIPESSVYYVDEQCDAFVVQDLATAIQVGAILLPSLFKLDELSIEQIEEYTRDGEQIVSVRYHFEPDKLPPKVFARSGTIDLLPHHHWVIDRADYIVGTKEGITSRALVSIHNKYDFASFKVPVLTSKKVDCYNTTPDKTWRYSRSLVYRFQETKDQTPQRFTLSDFGLPEPDFSTEPKNLRLWLVLGGVLLLLFAIVSFRLSARRHMTDQQA